MSYATARALPPDAIPVIDIGPLRDGSDPQNVAAALHRASTGLGFIYVSGHGIDAQTITVARELAFDFFRQPTAQKESVRIAGPHRGWIPQGGSRMQDDARADLKESFVWGFQDAGGATPADHALRGANRWPPCVPGLEQLSMNYYHAAHRVARVLMQGFALGLGLPRDFFLRHCDAPLSRCSYVYYPPQPESSGVEQFGVAPHTDFGVLTVLCQDDTGGLQVQDINGDWIHAPPIENTLVVNVGDLLARWTDGAYKSTPHRVVNNSGAERLSLVLAFDPEPSTVIDACEVYGADHQSSEPSITCGDYLIWRFGKSFSYRQEDS